MVKGICYQCKMEYNSSQLELYTYGTDSFYCCIKCRYDLISYQEKKAGKTKK